MLVDAFNIGAKFEFTNFSNDKYKFYLGDSVIQLKSDSKKGLANGDLGIIKNYIPAIESEGSEDKLIIEFNNREFEYVKDEMEEIDLAYAFSIHKAQGSEFPHIILPVVDYFKGMINKNLLYTAITRAKESITIIGDMDVFIQGIGKNPIARFSFLKELLKNRINV